MGTPGSKPEYPAKSNAQFVKSKAIVLVALRSLRTMHNHFIAPGTRRQRKAGEP